MLLPLAINSSPLERALANALAAPEDLQNLPNTIENRFSVPADEDLPFLIWEWGLQPIVPFLPNPRAALAMGRLWQKQRGTISAGHMARAWIKGDAAHEQTREKYYHLHLENFADHEKLFAIIVLSRQSQSLRNSLYRITYNYDVRAGEYASSEYGGAIYGVDSGIRPNPDWPLISMQFFAQGHIVASSEVKSELSLSIERRPHDHDYLAYSYNDYGDGPNDIAVTGQTHTSLIEITLEIERSADFEDAPFRPAPATDEKFGASHSTQAILSEET